MSKYEDVKSYIIKSKDIIKGDIKSEIGEGSVYINLQLKNLYCTTYDILNGNIPSKYIINKGATVLIWEDGTKTIVKRSEGDEYDKVKGFLWAYFQKHSGLSKNKANEYLKSLLDEDEKKAIELLESGKAFETFANVSESIGNAFKNMAETFRKRG